jgi:mannose-1-phosphate guanylyltransferase
VLAAGEGSRLSQLTRDAAGRKVPKQFCSLDGGPSLLLETLRRGQRVAGRDHLAVIVAAQHEQFWRGPLWCLPAGNVIVQPQNRGTAIGILFATLSIAALDPLARIVFLPADHHVRDEEALAGPLAMAAALAGRRDHLVLLGIEPDEPDPELGYVMPAGAVHPSRGAAVGRFVEKPRQSDASELIAAGALWNSFIFVATAATVTDLIRSRHPQAVDDMELALARGADAVAGIYERLPSLDFSRDVLQGAEQRLTLLPVPPCGWTDLGTPHRVGACLERLPADACRPRGAAGVVSLASAYRRSDLALQGAAS